LLAAGAPTISGFRVSRKGAKARGELLFRTEGEIFLGQLPDLSASSLDAIDAWLEETWLQNSTE
jgi:hypothetical protein